MTPLVLVHIASGLLGIVFGAFSVIGIFRRKQMGFIHAVFLGMTAVSCGSGFVFLPIIGITSAQLVAFFLMFLLTLSAYARYVRRLQENWVQIDAFATTGALFLNILIATAQSFLHVAMLRSLAPTQGSAVYVAVKLSLLIVFIVLAIAAARRAGNS